MGMRDHFQEEGLKFNFHPEEEWKRLLGELLVFEVSTGDRDPNMKLRQN